MTRIKLKIGRVTSQMRGIDKAALEAALRTEMQGAFDSNGSAFSSSRATAQADVSTRPSPLATRVAQATVKAVKS